MSWGTCEKVQLRRCEAGKGWGSQAYLPVSSCADRPAVALDPDGNATVAWAEWRSTADSPLKASRYSTHGASWGTASIVGAVSAAMLPALAADASGEVMALWLQRNGTRHNLLANRFE